MAIAALVTLSALARDRADTAGTVSGEATVVFTRVVAAGRVLTGDDMAVVEVPTRLRPQHAFASIKPAVGHAVAVAAGAGEIVTGSRLVSVGLLAGQPNDRVAMTVPVLGVRGTGAQAGSRVDLYTTGTGEQAAADVVVLAVSGANQADGSGGSDVPGVAESASGQPEAPRVMLALDPPAAARIAKQLRALAAGESFVLAIRNPGATGQ